MRFKKLSTVGVGLVTAFVGAGLPAVAQDSGEKLAPINVTAGVPAPGSPLLQATTIDVIMGEEKRREQGASLGETLDHLPGIDSVDTGNNTGKPVIRGLSGSRVRILSNGIGVDHQQYGTRHGPNIDPFLSDRIEVVRGASSILYGSDAIGGAVDVQPLALPFSDTDERRSSGEAKTAFHTNNEQWTTGLKGKSVGSQWSFNGGVTRREADNITTPDGKTAFNPDTPGPFQSSTPSDTPAYTDTLEFTDFEQTNGQVGVGYRDDFGELRLRYTGWRTEQNFLLPPPAVKPATLVAGVGQDLSNDEVQLDGSIPLGGAAGWELEPTFAWQNNRRRANAGGKPRSELFDGTIDLEFDQYTSRLEAKHGILGPFDGGTLGVEYREKQQVSRGTELLSPGGEVTNLSVFAFEEIAIGDFTLQAGVRQDRIETTGEESESRAPTSFSGRDSETYNITTGSLGGSYQLTNHLTVASNIATGFRAPTLFERFADGVHAGVAAIQKGEPGLDAENSLETDLSLRWRSERFSASATVYRNNIDDYIYLRDTGRKGPKGNLPVFQYQQTDATLTGVELSAELQATQRVSLEASLDVVDGENDGTSEDLPLMPANALGTAVIWQPGTLGPLHDPLLRLDVTYNASKDAAPGEPFKQFDSAPFGTASTDSYVVADFSMGASLGSDSGAPRLSVDITNLADTEYRDFLDTYKGYALSPGRGVRLSLNIPFGN